MAVYRELQGKEMALERHGYTATRHQHEVGTGYFDKVLDIVSGGKSAIRALEGSTEEDFRKHS
jgi:isocitrate lyase